MTSCREKLFTDVHRQQLETVGVTRIESVISKSYVDAVVGVLPDVSPVDIQDPASWYFLPAAYPGIIPSHHHQTQWDIR